MVKRLKSKVPARSVTDVGAGDYVKVNGRWEPIASNTAKGAARTPRSWTVRTTGGASYGMFEIDRYAKAEDLE